MSGQSRRTAWLVRCAVLFLFVSSAAGLGGCGGATGEGATDHPRASASGTVTFDGKPVPAGSVQFTHLDTGIYSNCPIDEGTYENESGQGPVIGKNTVTITGLDGENGKQLWSGAWSREVDVTGEAFEQNFEVKADEVQPYKDIGMDEEKPLYE